MTAKSKTGSKAKAGKAPRRITSSSPNAALERSVEHMRESLERSVTLSRDRLQEVVDDAVRRGRITQSDAEKLVSDLISRGVKQRDSLLKELERLVAQARREVGDATGRAVRAARDAADRPLARADRLRRRTGLPSSFPIADYDDLNATKVKSSLTSLTPAELRKVRRHERTGSNRKSVIEAVEKKLK